MSILTSLCGRDALRSSGFPKWYVAARLMSCTVQCSRSASIDSSGLVCAYLASRTLLRHLQSIYDVSERSDSPDTASTRPCDLVGPLPGTDFSSSRLESSTTPRWVRMVGGSSRIDGRWCGWLSGSSGIDGEWFGWLRYVRCCSPALSVLIRLVFSQRTRVDSFRVAACAACCVVHSASYPIRLIAVAIALALTTALDTSRVSLFA